MVVTHVTCMVAFFGHGGVITNKSRRPYKTRMSRDPPVHAFNVYHRLQDTLDQFVHFREQVRRIACDNALDGEAARRELLDLCDRYVVKDGALVVFRAQ